MGLLRTDVSRVEIERVLLSEESVGLAPLTIIANEYPVEVALRAQMPAGVNVTFQTRNENLNQSDDDPDDWNALFNEVDCVQSIRLDPGESRRLCCVPLRGRQHPGRTRQSSTYVPAARRTVHTRSACCAASCTSSLASRPMSSTAAAAASVLRW